MTVKIPFSLIFYKDIYMYVYRETILLLRTGEYLHDNDQDIDIYNGSIYIGIITSDCEKGDENVQCDIFTNYREAPCIFKNA